MPLTVQKLQHRVVELGKAAEGQAIFVSPVYVVTGPMTAPSASMQTGAQQVEVGQIWGMTHGTSWLMTTLQIAQELLGQPIVLRLLWNTAGNDPLFLQVEATVFLDGRAIGAFDWRHPALLLPEGACDGQPHLLTMQVYTHNPLPFGGVTLSVRYSRLWQLYHVMQTALDALLTQSEHAIARHALLERLNTAYTLLDLREGWRSERLRASADTALEYLHMHLTEGLQTGTRPEIVVSGHAHLDVGWLWPYWRTRQKIAHTVSNVLTLMERYPYYHYSQSQPQVLQWLKEDMPEMYARVKERVAEGRFEPVGAMWVEVDCNVPSGESLIRQILHGIHFTQQEFGITPRHIWLPDVFGYSAALPQIMRGCDIPVFMTTKISWNQFNRMPYDTFRWRGIDGSEVLTHFVTAPDLHEKTTYYSYNGPLRPKDMTGTWANYRQQAMNDHLLYLCGWGDGGGGPTEEQLERMRTLADFPELPLVRTGRVDEYFASLYERLWEHPRLPDWVGELYLEYHRGTYTSQARVKQANRRAELLYREVELLNAWASIYGMPFRQEQLNEGWKRILLNQFHDVLPGSSIREVYEDAERLYTETRAIAEQIRAEALSVLSKRLGWEEQGMVFLNTLPWERTDPIQTPGTLASSSTAIQQTVDWDGNTISLVDGVRIPPCGVSIMSSVAEAQQDTTAHACHVTRTRDGGISLHNDYYELRLDASGEISHLYDKRAERSVLAPGQTGNQLIAYEDRPLNFDAWDIDIYYEEKPYSLRENAHVHVIEEGPIRATAEVTSAYMSSRVTQRISLWRSSPRIDIATEIDWHEHQTLLKAAFPLAINSTRATYEIQFGNVERPTHRNTSWDTARFEVCAQRWVDLSEGRYGVSLLNDSKYGHDIHDNVMRLTLLKSGVHPDAQADQGLHRFTYSLLPHQGDWRDAQTMQHAYELNVPVQHVGARFTSPAPGISSAHSSEPVQLAAYSFVYTDSSHVVIETVKPAEDGNGLVVRLYEAYNQRGPGSITFETAIVSAQECNLLETAIGEATYQENTLYFQVRPFEIKTFRVRLAAT